MYFTPSNSGLLNRKSWIDKEYPELADSYSVKNLPQETFTITYITDYFTKDTTIMIKMKLKYDLQNNAFEKLNHVVQ